MSLSPMGVLCSLRPRETEQEGLFSYTAPQGETGRLRLEGFGSLHLAEVQQAVRTLEISAAIGQQEPNRQEVLSVGKAVVPRTSNPHLKIGVGTALLTLAARGCVSLILGPAIGAGEAVDLAALGLLGLAGIVLAITGFIRRAWWHRARRRLSAVVPGFPISFDSGTRNRSPKPPGKTGRMAKFGRFWVW